MARAVFKSASGINCDMGEKPSPVRALEPHVAFYTSPSTPACSDSGSR